MIYNLSSKNTVFNSFLAEVRDEEIQKDSLRFRRNLERMGELMAYEISKKLFYHSTEIITPLGVTQLNTIKYQPVLATVLRAGLPFHQGFLNYFDHADNAFVSAYRKHKGGEDDFEVKVEYISSPFLDDKILILIDPMLATGSSMHLVYKALLSRGTPKHIHIASVIASQEGVDYVQKHFPSNTTIWCGAIDDELTAHGYIVPGIGDAGDLAYGEKV